MNSGVKKLIKMTAANTAPPFSRQGEAVIKVSGAACREPQVSIAQKLARRSVLCDVAKGLTEGWGS